MIEANYGRALLYIENSMNYQKRSYDLHINKELESIFIEVINSKGKNLIIGCIYHHPSMNPTEFAGIYMSELLQIIFKRRQNNHA